MNKIFVQKIKVKSTEANTRLDLFLAEKLGITRSKCQKVIKDGLVEVNENVVTSKYLVASGDEVVLFEVERGKAPEVRIIAEDKDIIVIDKPSGVTAHPAPGEGEVTIAEIFAGYYKGNNDTGREMIVHRLDKGTSGVMIMAKNPRARDFLVKQFADRKVTKAYVALVHGRVVPKEGVIDMPLARDLSAKNRIAPADEGKDAKTLYKVNKYYDGYSLITANPKTGRTHQIRVHLAAIGHPLYGDMRYGSTETDAKRIFLHAAELSLIHPTTGKRVKYTSPLPTELEAILSKLTIE